MQEEVALAQGVEVGQEVVEAQEIVHEEQEEAVLLSPLSPLLAEEPKGKCFFLFYCMWFWRITIKLLLYLIGSSSDEDDEELVPRRSSKRKRETSTGTPAKTARPRGKDAKLSLAEAYQKKGEKTLKYLKDKLKAEKKERELAREHEKNLRKIELVQTLVQKGLSPEEIEKYLKLL